MIRTALCMFLAAWAGLLATSVSAQAHGSGYLAVGENGYFYRIDPKGAVRSLRVDAGRLAGVEVDLDNRTALVGVPGQGAVLRVDPESMAVVGTLATGLGRPASLVLDPNGRLLLADEQAGRLLKIGPNGGVSTVLSRPALLRAPRGGMLIHIDTTDLILQDLDPTVGAPLFRMRRDGTQITTVSTGQKPGFGIAQHLASGDYYLASTDTTGTAIYRLPNGTSNAGSWLPPSTNLEGAASLDAESASAAGQRLLVGAFNRSAQSRGLYFVDLVTRAVTRIADIPATLSGVTYARSRNLAAYRTERGRWTLRVNFPGLPGRQYVILPSLHGVHSSQVLPDGRRICLVPDGLTQFVAHVGDIFPFTTGFRSHLDASASAGAALDLSALGKWANGVVVWLVPIAIDARHPFGLAAIGDPIALELE